MAGVAASRDDDERRVVLGAGTRLGVAGSSASSVDVSRIEVSGSAERK